MANYESERKVVSRRKSLHERQSARAALQKTTPEFPAELSEWLARLALLYEVPFNNLVADERQLPPESIRFFYVDRNWLDSAVDGALSVGTQSSRDVAQHSVMQATLSSVTEQATKSQRARLLGRTRTGTQGDEKTGESDGSTMTGLLLRSALVSGWPGLEIRAFHDAAVDPQSPIDLLRMDHLAPDVLLCVFADVPGTVELREPPQSLCFGVHDEDAVFPRGLGKESPGRNYAVGKQIRNGDDVVSVTAVRRPTGSDGKQRVLDISATVGRLQKQLNGERLPPDQATAPLDSPALEGTLGPGAFALQMVKLGDQVQFIRKEERAAASVRVSAMAVGGTAPQRTDLGEQDILDDLFGG